MDLRTNKIKDLKTQQKELRKRVIGSSGLQTQQVVLRNPARLKKKIRIKDLQQRQYPLKYPKIELPRKKRLIRKSSLNKYFS